MGLWNTERHSPLSAKLNGSDRKSNLLSRLLSTHCKMCYDQLRSLSEDEIIPPRTTRSPDENAVVVEDLRSRLAETQARLERARAREAELSRRLQEMKRFVSVMEILETYLKRRYQEQQQHVERLLSVIPQKQ